METNTNLCVGCNRCISVCPVQANNAMLEGEKNVIHVQENLCIFCGNCIEHCTHHARWNQDDSEAFFLALQKGEPISLLAAPSTCANIPGYRSLFGYLKQKGVRFIYDVSFGADISAWGYLHALQDGKGPLIAQPCPVVVRYIEKFLPELLPRLAPVHSPAMCLAIYMKDIVKIEGSYAFLSPCIAKKVEFEDGETGDFIQYNITYTGLMQYMQDNGIHLNDAPQADFDKTPGALGFTFPRPGGLGENLRFYLDEDIWVRQVEGIDEVKKYLTHYAQRLQQNKPVPMIVDALSCKQGCNNGTGTDKSLHLDDLDFNINKRRKNLDVEKAKALMQHFDNTLNPDAFSRGYTIRSHERPIVSNVELEEAFLSLGKTKEDDRHLNCFSCGYDSCRSFAKAIALQQNHKRNCVQYMSRRLDEQTEELRQKNESIIDSLRYASKIQRNLLPNEEEMAFSFKEYHLRWIPKDIVGGDLYWVKAFYNGTLLCVGDCTGHGTPGALLTMLVISALDTVVNEKNHSDVEQVVRAVDAQLSKALNAQQKQQDMGWQTSTHINDGVDLALIFLKNSGGADLLLVGGVRVLVCQQDDLQRFKGQRLHLGDGSLAKQDKIRVHKLENDTNSRYFIMTDGLSDQIGEESGLPFGYKRTETLLKENSDKSLADMFSSVHQAFNTHKGNEDQRDDLTFFAFQR